MIRMIVGLGNPGPEYEGTRHNAGFWWVDALARELGAVLSLDRAYHGRAARVNRPGGPLWLLEPMTYMNRSGQSVGPLARFFKVAPEEILVVHDELDLLPGEARLKRGGGNGGHNGLKDIQAHLGSADFWRLRLGIGHPGVKAEVADYVLRKPSPDHREALLKAIEQSLQAAPLMLDGEMDRALARIHAKPPRPKPPRPAGAAADGAGATVAPPPGPPRASGPATPATTPDTRPPHGVPQPPEIAP